MLLMKWHENKSCLIRFDCSHIENQGRKIINFFGISRIQIRTKIRLDHKDLSWTTFWWLDADRTLDFLNFKIFRSQNSKISKFCKSSLGNIGWKQLLTWKLELTWKHYKWLGNMKINFSTSWWSFQVNNQVSKLCFRVLFPS